jgi:hypothetical protein
MLYNRQSWKYDLLFPLQMSVDNNADHFDRRHVFRDIRPYVCTFEDCQDAGKLYASRNDWMYHELQIHRRQFVCWECHVAYPNRHSMQDHIRSAHPTAFGHSQMPIVLDLCSRQVSETFQTHCVLCGKELQLLELQSHLAAHLEEIALFILPGILEEELEEDSNSTDSRDSRKQTSSISDITAHEDPKARSQASSEDLAQAQGRLNTSPSTQTNEDYESKVALWNDTEISVSEGASVTNPTPRQPTPYSERGCLVPECRERKWSAQTHGMARIVYTRYCFQRKNTASSVRSRLITNMSLDTCPKVFSVEGGYHCPIAKLESDTFCRNRESYRRYVSIIYCTRHHHHPSFANTVTNRPLY